MHPVSTCVFPVVVNEPPDPSQLLMVLGLPNSAKTIVDDERVLEELESHVCKGCADCAADLEEAQQFCNRRKSMVGFGSRSSMRVLGGTPFMQENVFWMARRVRARRGDSPGFRRAD